MAASGGPVVTATVRLLGPVATDGTVELLAYLALHEAGATRDQVLEAMWLEADPRRTRFLSF